MQIFEFILRAFQLFVRYHNVWRCNKKKKNNNENILSRFTFYAVYLFIFSPFRVSDDIFFCRQIFKFT